MMLLTTSNVDAAADPTGVHVLPQSRGDGSGRDWANARGADSDGLQAAWDAAAERGAVFIGSGTYEGGRLRIREGGADVNTPRQLVGVDTGGGSPRFVSDFDKDNPGSTGGTFLDVQEQVAHLAIEGLSIEGYQTPVLLRGRNENVTIADLTIERSRDAIVVHGGATEEEPDIGSRGVLIRDTDIRHYTKRGVRIRDGVSDMRVINVHLDAGGLDWATERFAMGFHMHGNIPGVYNQGITFIDCSANNHWDPNGDEYWNADGFCAERQNRDITYIRCTAINNTDGGWDDKSENPVLIDCVAMGNKRNFRFWSQPGLAMMINCLSAYATYPGGTGGANGLWVSRGAHVIAERCTFYEDEHYAIDVHAPDADDPTSVELRRSIVVMTQNSTPYSVPDHVRTRMIDVIEVTAGGDQADAELVAPSRDADPRSNAFDSRRYPDHGYRGR